MLTFWNRKQLYVTFSMEQQIKLRELLSKAAIPCYVRVVDRRAPLLGGSTRGRAGTFGEDRALECEYILYVPKKRYEQAQHLLAGL